LYDLLNAGETERGAKPIFKERGPYAYKFGGSMSNKIMTNFTCIIERFGKEETLSS
jgi:hypothetical protein